MYPGPTAGTQSNVDLVDFRMAGPDKSVGDSMTINGASINITMGVRDVLCPKGTTPKIQN
jgi:hypothetical protein